MTWSKILASDDQRQKNNLFLSLIVDGYEGRFSRNGAVVLNHMIQERSGLSKEDVFVLIGDAIKDGVLVIDRGDDKKLGIDKSRVVVLRDKFSDVLPKMQGEVVSEKWSFGEVTRRELTENEKAALSKNIKHGGLKEVNPETNNHAPKMDHLANYIERTLRKAWIS